MASLLDVWEAWAHQTKLSYSEGKSGAIWHPGSLRVMANLQLSQRM